MYLIEDCMILEAQVDESSKKEGPIKLEGLFQRAETQNQNGRVYSKAILEREINKMRKILESRPIVGEIDHPSSQKINLDKVSHKIVELRMDGNEVYGRIETLTTPYGKILEALIRDGIKLGISSRGTGTLSESGNKISVNDDYQMVTFDMVNDPSTQGAYPSVYECVMGEWIPARSIKYGDGIVEIRNLGPKAAKIVSKILKADGFNVDMNESAVVISGSRFDSVRASLVESDFLSESFIRSNVCLIGEEKTDRGEMFQNFVANKMKKWGIRSFDDLKGTKRDDFLDEIDTDWVSRDDQKAALGEDYVMGWNRNEKIDGFVKKNPLPKGGTEEFRLWLDKMLMIK